MVRGPTESTRRRTSSNRSSSRSTNNSAEERRTRGGRREAAPQDALSRALQMQEQEEHATESRYHRQAALLQEQGWNQSKLENAKVAVIGSDALANYAALTLSAFGFGSVSLYGQGHIDSDIRTNHQRTGTTDYSKGFLFFEAREGTTKAKALEDIINKINPEIDFKGLNIGMQRFENTALMQKPDLIVEATNDPESKISMMDYAIMNNIPLVSMSAGDTKGGVGILKPDSTEEQRKVIENILFDDISYQKQDPVVSQVIAGMGIEEARKIINPMDGEKVLDDVVIYNLQSNERFEHKEDKKIEYDFDLSNYSVCLIGAGALGNFVGLGLALRNVGKMTVVDFDITETTNLNRQVLLYEGVDKEKATALVDKLKAINPKGNYRAKIDKIVPDSAEFFRRNKFDLVIDTVDNNRTRALLNYFSLRYHIPFMSGGTRYNSGQANICIPEQTGCLNCQANIDELSLGTYRSHSCIHAAQPSVITSNQITGGMMVGEAASILDPEKYGDYARGELKFVSNEEFRVALLPAAVNRCDCYQDKEKLDGWHKKMEGVYDQ